MVVFQQLRDPDTERGNVRRTGLTGEGNVGRELAGWKLLKGFNCLN